MNYNKTYFFILLLMLVSFMGKAQKDSILKKAVSKNIIYLEAFGSGAYYNHYGNGSNFYEFGTLNCERILKTGIRRWYALRVGFTASHYHDKFINSNTVHNVLNVPLMFNLVTNPSSNNHVEHGLGVVFTHYTDPYEGDDNQFGITFSLKYRYQSNKKTGFFFAIGYTPVLFPKKIMNQNFSYVAYLLSGGLCLGYHF